MQGFSAAPANANQRDALERELTMIAGTIIIEDFTLHFRAVPMCGPVDAQTIEYSVCCGATGASETVLCAAGPFALVLAVALHPDGALSHLTVDEYEAAWPQVMPKDPDLRWIP